MGSQRSNRQQSFSPVAEHCIGVLMQRAIPTAAIFGTHVIVIAIVICSA